MLKRALLPSIASLCVLAGPASADVISDWNERTVLS